jgi:hypothetical protein
LSVRYLAIKNAHKRPDYVAVVLSLIVSVALLAYTAYQAYDIHDRAAQVDELETQVAQVMASKDQVTKELATSQSSVYLAQRFLLYPFQKVFGFVVFGRFVGGGESARLRFAGGFEVLDESLLREGRGSVAVVLDVVVHVVDAVHDRCFGGAVGLHGSVEADSAGGGRHRVVGGYEPDRGSVSSASDGG